ncbi:hypothetical protein ABIC94_002131 [Variovorax paradoxus]|uniref:Pycsar system effector family protein n=1 Tax=Variovorax paradoxus TaxID=34073 RepID=UPI0033967F4B
MDDKDRLGAAQWIFERHLAWIAAAEVKVGVVVAIDTALIGGLAAAFSTSDLDARTAWTYLWTLSAAGMAVLGIFCAAMAVLPRTNGPKSSLLFFGRVLELDLAEYQEKIRTVSPTDLLDDYAAQIHRNAEIAGYKYGWVTKSIRWSFACAIPWAAAVGLLIKT